MKRLFISLTIILLTVTFCLSSNFVINKRMDKLAEITNTALLAAKTGDFSDDKMHEIHKVWEKEEGLLCFLLPHESMDNLELHIRSLSVYINLDDKNEYIHSLTEIIYQLEHTKSSLIPTLDNIF